ncbi:DNA repair protein RecO [Plasticicumulans acidivorans]|uniref:DNA repair protein RecO n=1 Tax=Plasticicumulans acidivorans TaxID=886464 RepID=A0A317MXK9_9GAMM|nr:DNA repair protein RecO [Plasticicumulans acidivorans]PWV63367.1 DNA replication and repair protein RecO [Plasticicumulans acidivorans]
MRVELEPAYVLHARPYRDSSLLLELFTLHHGRIGAVSRGARGPRSRLKGLLRPFQPLLISYLARGELASLNAAEAAGQASWLSGERAVAGLYLNELLLALLARDDPHPLLLGHYRAAVGALAEATDPQPALRVFERELLEALGYAAALVTEADGVTPVQADRDYRYLPEAGPLPLQSASGGIVVRGAILLALAAGEFPDAATLAGARRLSRALIDHWLGGRPLRARELARAFRAVESRGDCV